MLHTEAADGVCVPVRSKVANGPGVRGVDPGSAARMAGHEKDDGAGCDMLFALAVMRGAQALQRLQVPGHASEARGMP